MNDLDVLYKALIKSGHTDAAITLGWTIILENSEKIQQQMVR